MVQFDILYLLVQKPQLNIMAMLSAAMQIYSNWANFLKPDLNVLRWLKAIIIDVNSGMFVGKRFGNKGKYACIEVRRFFILTLRTFISVGPSVGKLLYVCSFLKEFL